MGVRPLSRLAAQALDALFPPACLACSAPTQQHGAFCPDCWRTAEFLDSGRVCEGCGAPLEARALLNAVGDFEGIYCDFCVTDRMFPGRIRAALLYQGSARSAVLRFKYADALHAAPIFAGWMARAGAEVLADAPTLVPVPLHWRRHWRRRYNQSAELARALSRRVGAAYRPELLARRRATAPQEGKSRAERLENVADAFAARPAQGLRVVLVDDVVTTGATLAACAQALTAAGATQVDALALTRTALEDFNPEDSPSLQIPEEMESAVPHFP